MAMYSHAEGSGTISGGRSSHAEGDGTITNNVAEHAEGIYNKSHAIKDGDSADTLHSIGVGTSITDRKNAVEIMQNGDHYILGIGDYDGRNIENAQTVQEVIDNKLTKTTLSEKIYGTDESGNQITYDKDDFNKIDDFRINNISQVVNKIVNLIIEDNLNSDSNNLATITAIRAFVNSSVESVAANYITSSASGDAFATKSSLVSGPWYYAGSLKSPTRSDYAVVINDEDHDNVSTRYTYVVNPDTSVGQWAYQYSFNMQFTQAQIDAINSGITSTKIALYDAHLLDTNNPHSVTKSQVGLGNVVNTGDSAIPVIDGTTKFTTGGAYTELNKKLDKFSPIVTSTLSINSTGDTPRTSFKFDAEVRTITAGVTREGLGATAPDAIAIGYETKASGIDSAAFGNNTQASQQNQFVIGFLNDNKSNTIFEVGNGNWSTGRKNVFEVYQDGRAKVYGEPTENNDAVRYQELEPLRKLVNGLTDAQIRALNEFAKSLTVSEVNN